MKRRFICAIIALCMLSVSIAVCTAGASVASGSDPSGTDYGLPRNCEDGNILHCFNWTLRQIKDELPGIAQAGFTSIQTSPLQPHDGNYQWYWLYQPTNFTIGNEIGSYSDLQELCAEADKYGIKIIVDVVANHLAGGNSGSWSNKIDSSLRNSAFFHNEGASQDEDDRHDITYKNIGMPDLNTENEEIQRRVVAMLNDLKDAGVDGVRWDAAKHIGLPSENSAFWTKVSQVDLYQYGEILGEPAGDSGKEMNDQLISEYARYIGVTDEQYSAAITQLIRDESIGRSKGNWLERGISADRIVYWGESHDTYGNKGWTNKISQNIIDRAYAVLGARAGSQCLYLSRPYEKNHTSIAYGVKGSTHYTSPEVAAVNHFHNAMTGTAEAFSASRGCFVICREGGAVIVSASDANFDASVVNISSMVPSGTYTDEISGSTWTVTDSKISGHIGSSGIAVIYDTSKLPGGILLGDSDHSGDVTVFDATCIQRYLVSLEELSEDDKRAANVDKDAEITIFDATYIQRYLVSLDCPDGIGKPL